MKAIIGIAATMMIVASVVCLLATDQSSYAGQQPALQLSHRLQANPAGPRVLFFAPAENRNLALDEGVLELRRAGACVAYVTDSRQYDEFVASSDWDLVIVADGDMDSAARSADLHLTAGRIVVGLSTLGPAAQESEVSLLRVPTGGPRDGDPPAEPVAIGTKEIAKIIACFNRHFGCRVGCMITTPAFSPQRVECDQACDDELVGCLNNV